MGDATTAPPRTLDVPHSTNRGSLPDWSTNEESHSSMNHLDPHSSGDCANVIKVSTPENNIKRKRSSTNNQVINRLDYVQDINPPKTNYASIIEKSDPKEKELQVYHQLMVQRESCSKILHDISRSVMEVAMNDTDDPGNHQTLYSLHHSQNEVAGSNVNSYETSTHKMPETDEFNSNSPSLVGTHSPANQPCDIMTNITPPSFKCKESSNLIVNKIVQNSVSESALKPMSTPNYLANRQTHTPNSIFTPCPSKSILFTTPPASLSKMPLSCPERVDSTLTKSSPRVRLSLSLDGKAELTADYPSPPIQISRPKSASGNLFTQIKSESRRRSQSLILPCSNSSETGQPSSSSVPRRPIGRSRDARSWTFCCGGEGRDELTRQAENESHGSAVAAISLIRSAFNPVAKTCPKKRKASVSDQNFESSKKHRVERRLPNQIGFQYTGTSSFLLSTTKDDSSNYMVLSPSEDSDKENWLPQQNGSPRRRPLPSSRSDKSPRIRTILSDNDEKTSNSSGFGSFKNKKWRLSNSLADVYKDCAQVKVCTEAENSGNREVSPSKVGDLGAIQGLLSLSKGNWR